MGRNRGRPVCPGRIDDPLVVVEVPLSVRQRLRDLKIIAGCTYGEVINALLGAVDSAGNNSAGEGDRCLRQ